MGRRAERYRVPLLPYRKQASEAGQPLLPESEFRLYAVCSRYPHNLAGELPWEPVQEGVYRCRRGTDVIQVVVAGQLPQVEHNAPLHLFSGSAGQVAYGASHYRQRTQDTSTLLGRLFAGYQGEGIAMPYTMEDFRRDYAKEHFHKLTPEEKQEALEGLPLDHWLDGFSVEEIEDYLRRRREASASSPEASKSGRRGRRKPKR